MLEIDLLSFIATVIIFLGLIAFLNAKLYKPLLSFMDAREASIKKDEEMANSNLSKSGETKFEIEEILNEARAEATKIKSQALETMKAKASKEISSKKEEFELDLKKYQDDLKVQKEELKADLMGRVLEFKNTLRSSLSKI